jgi:hypothetical protein
VGGDIKQGRHGGYVYASCTLKEPNTKDRVFLEGKAGDSCMYIALPQGLKPEAYSGARMHTSRNPTLAWYLAGGLTRLIRLIIYGRSNKQLS